jgi:hypothetical protein
MTRNSLFMAAVLSCLHVTWFYATYHICELTQSRGQKTWKQRHDDIISYHLTILLVNEALNTLGQRTEETQPLYERPLTEM